MAKLKYYGLWAISLSVMFAGVGELNQATNGIQLFRGLFWMVLAGWVIFNNDKPKDTP